jgi:hypothetical protein
MTAQTLSSSFPSTVPMEFACLRSEFIDEFARLEIAVGHCLRRLDLQQNLRKCCFDQLVGKLAKAKPGPKLSRKNVAELARLPEACQPFQHLRASIVHGVMTIVSGDGARLALFRNAADVLDNSHACYALSLEDLRNRIHELAAITERVRTIASPSSPPRPAPAEAAGP